MTHLTISSGFDLSKVNIPSVKYLIFSAVRAYELDINKYYFYLMKFIPMAIENIVFNGLLSNDDIECIKSKFKNHKPNIFFPDMPEKYIIW